MSSVVNIAAYKFVPLEDLTTLRSELLTRAQEVGLKGTILLAEEGINLFLAGTASGIESWLKALQADPRFTELEVKYSYSLDIPFRKMLVKIKREIIRMNHPAIEPRAGRAPAVTPTTLAKWLDQGVDDEGRPVVMLDTRNAFEVNEGTFDGAIDWRIDRFTQFPDAVQANRESLEGKTIVSFCTGGIRCEKAAIYMAQVGIDHVYQLDGGILKYFEDTDGRGFHGNCFVFDERVSLDPGLAPSVSEDDATTA